MFDRFTDRARNAMSFAREEAQRLKHNQIATEHILLGLVKERTGPACNVLENLEVDLEKIREEVEKGMSAVPSIIKVDPMPFSPCAKKVLEFAIDEARKLHHNYLGTEHLLLGLLREREGLASQVLEHLGLQIEGTRSEVVRFLGGSR